MDGRHIITVESDHRNQGATGNRDQLRVAQAKGRQRGLLD